MVYHGNQHFEERHRPIEHSCKKKNEKLKCRTLIETNIQGETKYKDKKGNKYPDKIGRHYQKFRRAKRRRKRIQYPPGKKKEQLKLE